MLKHFKPTLDKVDILQEIRVGGALADSLLFEELLKFLFLLLHLPRILFLLLFLSLELGALPFELTDLLI